MNYYAPTCFDTKCVILRELALLFDNVGTVYHLVIYMQSNKIRKANIYDE